MTWFTPEEPVVRNFSARAKSDGLSSGKETIVQVTEDLAEERRSAGRGGEWALRTDVDCRWGIGKAWWYGPGF